MSEKTQSSKYKVLPKVAEKRVVKLNEGSAKARRSAARLAAVQVLYQMALSGHDAKTALRDFINHRIGFELDGDTFVPADRDLLTAIVQGCVDMQDNIQDILKGQLAKKNKDTIDPVLEAVLQAGIFELLAHPDIDAPIIISDYMNVTHAFYEDGAPKMINAILDHVATSLR